MASPTNTLLIYYGGFGYIIFLGWGVVLGDAIKDKPPAWTRRAVLALQVLGLVHPAAAFAAWDLRRLLEQSGYRGAVPAQWSLTWAVVSVVAALAVVALVGRAT